MKALLSLQCWTDSEISCSITQVMCIVITTTKADLEFRPRTTQYGIIVQVLNFPSTFMIYSEYRHLKLFLKTLKLKFTNIRSLA